MVFLYDLDGRMRDVDIHHHHHHHHQLSKPLSGFAYLPTPTESLSGHEEESSNINSFSAALACYPIVSALAANLDLNSLHNLSRTCRQFRGTLLLYRDQLVSRTLHCSNEVRQPQTCLPSSPKSQSANVPAPPRLTVSSTNRFTSGKNSKCARDLVRDCRNCGTIICRNCSAKAPSTFAIRGRHRRLCSTCLRAPLDVHLEPRALARSSSPTSCRKQSRPSWDEAVRSCSETSWTSQRRPQTSRRLTSSSANSFSGDVFGQDRHASPERSLISLAFKRTPCTCTTYNHLCSPCGSDLVAHDRDYERGWIWRNKYSAYVGVAEGNKGVECGRRASCLAARFVEQESDCDPETLEAAHRVDVDEANTLGRTWEGGSFVMQEVEGIGGIVKMKVKTLVLVGAEVDGLDEDLSSDDEYRKKSDKKDMFKGERSWCSWCERVVPGATDVWNHAWDIGGDAK